jgi:magnesium-transporting ATPase (P-type)
MVKFCKNQAKGGVMGDDYLEPINDDYLFERIAILSSRGLLVLGLMKCFVPKSSIKVGEQLGAEFVNGRHEGKWLTMIGLCAILDHQSAHSAGVRVAMITGDHKNTATAIGKQQGLVDEKYHAAVTRPELDAMSDTEIRKCCQEHNVFARASPQNKIRIVKALQAKGEITSMTGDGVNDVPALKATNVGVAMGKEGNDVARKASEMILSNDNFATIVYAIKQGRVVVVSAKLVEINPRYADLRTPDMINCTTLRGVTTCVPTELLLKIRATAINILDFGAILIRELLLQSPISKAGNCMAVNDSLALTQEEQVRQRFVYQLV